jgi:hypothetical protein
MTCRAACNKGSGRNTGFRVIGWRYSGRRYPQGMMGRWAHDISGPNKVRVVMTERRVSFALKIKRKSRTSTGSGRILQPFPSGIQSFLRIQSSLKPIFYAG